MKGNYYGTILLYKDEQAPTGCLLCHLPGAHGTFRQLPGAEIRRTGTKRRIFPAAFGPSGDLLGRGISLPVLSGKIKEHQKALKARVEKLVRPAMKLSEWEKEKYVHDFICENVHYDKLKKSYSHEIIGPLGQGVGVCEGIAKSVKVLCDALGIWCMIAICGNNPEKGIKYRHTWNIVKIGGTYYHLDATFDNTLGKHSFGAKEIRYDYFNLDDKNIFRDHEPLIAPAPACTDGDHFYYKEKKMSFTKTEDVYKRSLQAAKKGKMLTFHWRGGYLTRAVLDELLDLIKKAGAEKGKVARIALNWPQAVLRLEYVEDGQENVTMEEANEGEQE